MAQRVVNLRQNTVETLNCPECLSPRQMVQPDCWCASCCETIKEKGIPSKYRTGLTSPTEPNHIGTVVTCVFFMRETSIAILDQRHGSVANFLLGDGGRRLPCRGGSDRLRFECFVDGCGDLCELRGSDTDAHSIIRTSPRMARVRLRPLPALSEKPALPQTLEWSHRRSSVS